MTLDLRIAIAQRLVDVADDDLSHIARVIDACARTNHRAQTATSPSSSPPGSNPPGRGNAVSATADAGPAGQKAGTFSDDEPIAVARRCPTCRDVVIAGVCGCEDDVDRAVAEALVQELAFTTVTTTPAPAAIDDDMRPGEAVRVEVARGSKTGPIVEVGSFVGWERNERTGERMALVLVGGVVRRVERGKARRG